MSCWTDSLIGFYDWVTNSKGKRNLPFNRSKALSLFSGPGHCISVPCPISLPVRPFRPGGQVKQPLSPAGNILAQLPQNEPDDQHDDGGGNPGGGFGIEVNDRLRQAFHRELD